MKLGLNIFLCSLFILLAQAAAFEITDPLWNKNQHPLYLTTLYLSPVPAKTLEPGQTQIKTNFSYSSIYIDQKGQNNEYVFDMELAYFSFGLSRGYANGLELGLEIPAIFMWQGFLDQFLIDYHNLIHLPNYGREFAPINVFQYKHKALNGPNLNNAKQQTLGLGDATINIKKSIYENGVFGENLTCLLALKLPTGDPKKGHGSGSFDYGFQLILKKHVQWLTCHMGLGRALLGPYQGNFIQNFDPANMAFLQIGAPILNQKAGLIAQIETQSPIVPNADTNHFKYSSIELTCGVNWLVDENAFMQVSLAEDIKASAAAPDFSLNISYSRTFN